MGPVTFLSAELKKKKKKKNLIKELEMLRACYSAIK